MDKNVKAIAKELKKIYWDADLSDKGFNDMAVYVQRLVLEAEIKGMKQFCDIQGCDFDHVHEQIKEIEIQLEELKES